jgi:hypothetical protein
MFCRVWGEAAKDLRRSAIRHQNEGLAATARELNVSASAPFAFLCECNDSFCTDYVRLTLSQYNEARDDDRVILCPGHPAPNR